MSGHKNVTLTSFRICTSGHACSFHPKPWINFASACASYQTSRYPLPSIYFHTPTRVGRFDRLVSQRLHATPPTVSLASRPSGSRSDRSDSSELRSRPAQPTRATADRKWQTVQALGVGDCSGIGRRFWFSKSNLWTWPAVSIRPRSFGKSGFFGVGASGRKRVTSEIQPTRGANFPCGPKN
jgi:hypothetical protein